MDNFHSDDMLAIPNVPKQYCKTTKIGAEVDAIESVTSLSAKFPSVSQYYHDFSPATDELVIKIMQDRNPHGCRRVLLLKS